MLSGEPFSHFTVVQSRVQLHNWAKTLILFPPSCSNKKEREASLKFAALKSFFFSFRLNLLFSAAEHWTLKVVQLFLLIAQLVRAVSERLFDLDMMEDMTCGVEIKSENSFSPKQLKEMRVECDRPLFVLISPVDTHNIVENYLLNIQLVRSLQSIRWHGKIIIRFATHSFSDRENSPHWTL